MQYKIDGNIIEADDNGYLLNQDEWSEKLAEVIAAQEQVELTQRHWDVINYLRDEYTNNAGKQPNVRTIVKAMQEMWDDKNIDTKVLYELFPKNPDKLASKIGGLPETKRKGGY